MRRTRKRLWTALLVTGSGLLIVAALAVGAVRVLDMVAPKYRQELAQRIATLVERPVRIERLDLEWQGLRPALVLGKLAVLTQDRRAVIFSAGEFSIAISWEALVAGELRPAAIALRDLTLGLEWRTDGQLGIRDIDGGELIIDFPELARWTERIRRVRIEDGTLEWAEPGVDQPQVMTDVDMDLTHAARRYRLKGQARLPADWGELLQFSLDAEGDMAAFKQMQMNGQGHVAKMRPQPWLAPFVRRTLRIEGAATDADGEFTLRGFNLVQAHLNFETDPAKVIRKKTSELVGSLPGPSGEFELTNRADGWKLELRRLSYGTGVETQGQVDYKYAADAVAAVGTAPTPIAAHGNSLQARLDRIDFGALVGWTSVLSVARALHLPTAGTAGEMRDLRLDLSQPPEASTEFSIQATLVDLAMPAKGARPGFRGLGGTLTANPRGGEMQLQVQQGSADIPEVFNTPLVLDHFKGHVIWARGESGWEVKGEDLALQSRSLQVASGFLLNIPDDDSSPHMSLQGTFTGLAPDAKHYIPHPPVLAQEVGDWLRAAIVDGQARNGRVEIEGLLAEFPYADPGAKGHFLLALDAENAILQYGADWPRLDKINGQLQIVGTTLTIESPSAEILGAAVGPTTVLIDDFRKPTLFVDGIANTDISTQLRFLGESPLKTAYGPLLTAIAADGPATLNLHIELPLGNIDDYKVDGRVQLNGVTLRYGGLEAPITQLRGALGFNNAGLHADTLDAKLFGLPVVARLTPALEGKKTGARLEADMAVEMPRDSEALGKLVPPVWLSPLRGQSHWQLSGIVNTEATPTEFRLLSDLVGTEIALGPPFGKPADKAMPAEISYLPQSQGFEFRTRLGSVLRTRIAFKSDKSGKSQMERGILQLGDGDTPQLPAQPGLWLAGSLPELDLDASRRYLVAVGRASAGDSATGAAGQLRGGQLQLGVLRLGGHQFRDTQIKLSPTTAGWDMVFSGTDAQGRLGWKAQGRGQLNGEFERLVLTPPKSVPEDSVKAPPDKTAFDPATLPALRLHSKTLLLGDYELGKGTFDAAIAENGLRLQEISLSGGKMQIEGSGEWRRINDASSANLKLNMKATDLKGLLGAIGYAQSVTAKSADVSADLSWTPDVKGLTNKTLNGQMKFDLKDGALLNVDPGAGRVLALLSFYALPRRLTLDFSDITNKGTQFDIVQGSYLVREGVAHTEDLKVKSPAVSINVRGDVNFATRSYDQLVTIKPKVSSGVALAGAALAGPVVGIALFLAQSVLNQPVEGIAAATYHMGGTFKDPEIKPVNVEKRAKSRAAPQPSSVPPAPAAPVPAPKNPAKP